MPFARVTALITLSTAVLASASCVEDRDYGEASNLRPNINRNVEVNVNDNIAEDSEIKLERILELPFEPEETVFREDPVVATSSNRAPGPTDKRLTVVLRYTPENSRKLVKALASKKPPFKTEVASETWFPAELKAKSETTGNQKLKGSGFSAEGITKPPWLDGSIIKIDDTNFFVLILQTK